jgi:hypothetical protein
MMFLVTWKIDLDADTHKEAAELARALQLDDSSIATCFDVRNSETGETQHIDLSLSE